MKAEIEQRLQALIGEPLSDMWRYAGYQKFEFGVRRPCKNRKGQDITRSDWGLVVGGDWRITGSQGYIVSSDDFDPVRSISQIIEKAESTSEDSRDLPSVANTISTRRDEAASEFYRILSDTFPLVESIEADEDGSLRISMTAGYILEILASGANDGERWRFLPKDDDAEHFVITPKGILE